MFNILVKTSPDQKIFLVKVRNAMGQYFGKDQRRIDHALQVSVYAENLLAYIEADPVITLASAYLHDIGIHEAEQKHGSSSGKWQELEGPPIAREILSKLGADDSLINRVAEIVGNHHTAAAVDSPEFRILWDADAMVNFAEILPNKTEQQIEDILQNHMVTEAGFRIARRLFLKDVGGHKRWPTDD
jgi:HD superfamily phosphodiesterase